jgi:ATP-binding cassette subfamily F protein 3
VDLNTTCDFVRVAGEYASFRAALPDLKCRTGKATHQVMSSYDIAEQIREFLPGTEEILVQYLSGYLVDEASEDEDILQVARYVLESVAMDKPDVLEHLMTALSALLQDQLTRREKAQSVPKLQRLDKVLDMSKAGAMSNTIAFAEGVDLESINKGKCVNDVTYCNTCI